jgi:hypothetical protein
MRRFVILAVGGLAGAAVCAAHCCTDALASSFTPDALHNVHLGAR